MGGRKGRLWGSEHKAVDHLKIYRKRVMGGWKKERVRMRQDETCWCPQT